MSDDTSDPKGHMNEEDTAISEGNHVNMREEEPNNMINARKIKANDVGEDEAMESENSAVTDAKVCIGIYIKF